MAEVLSGGDDLAVELRPRDDEYPAVDVESLRFDIGLDGVDVLLGEHDEVMTSALVVLQNPLPGPPAIPGIFLGGVVVHFVDIAVYVERSLVPASGGRADLCVRVVECHRQRLSAL